MARLGLLCGEASCLPQSCAGVFYSSGPIVIQGIAGRYQHESYQHPWADWTQGHWLGLWFQFKWTTSNFPISSQHWQRVLPYFFSKLAPLLSEMTHSLFSIQAFYLVPAVLVFNFHFQWKHWNILSTPSRPLSCTRIQPPIPSSLFVLNWEIVFLPIEVQLLTHSLDLIPSGLLKDFGLPHVIRISLSAGSFHQPANTSLDFIHIHASIHSLTSHSPFCPLIHWTIREPWFPSTSKLLETVVHASGHPTVHCLPIHCLHCPP